MGDVADVAASFCLPFFLEGHGVRWNNLYVRDLDLRYSTETFADLNLMNLRLEFFFVCENCLFSAFKNTETPNISECFPHEFNFSGQGADWGVCDSEEDPILAGSFPICLATQNLFC